MLHRTRHLLCGYRDFENIVQKIRSGEHVINFCNKKVIRVDLCGEILLLMRASRVCVEPPGCKYMEHKMNERGFGDHN